MDALLTTTDLTRLGAAADALLSPMAGSSTAAWRAGVAAAMRELFRVDNALFVTSAGERPRFYCDTMTRAQLARFEPLTRTDPREGRLRAVDTLVDAWFQQRAAQGVEVYNEPLNDRMLGGQLHRSTIVNDAVRPGGLHDFLGFMTHTPGGDLMLFMGYERRGRSPFGPERELAVLQALLPAFRAGHAALVRFGAQRTALGATLDQLDEALLVLGPDGRTIHRSPALGRLLGLEPEREQVEAALMAAGRALTGGAPAAGALARVEQRLATAAGRYVVRAARLPAEVLGEPGGVLVTLDREAAGAGPQTEAAAAALAPRFGLTPREAEVAAALARRLTNAELARALGISPHTAERHTERVLGKLGVRSRHDVARCLAGAEPARAA
jgi:DNA-binding CsgD family transcriptional regulator/PAS domain-containing protein